MNERAKSNLRKWHGLIVAILLYYIVHEGSHVIVALIYGVFEKMKILGLGVQVVINRELLTDLQTAIFCIIGSISTLFVAYLLVLFTGKIAQSKNKIFKAICFYLTIALLIIDPLYLAFMHKFVGGGDMNGILLFGVPEIAIQAVFGVVAIINAYIIAKKIYPSYKESFKGE